MMPCHRRTEGCGRVREKMLVEVEAAPQVIVGGRRTLVDMLNDASGS